MIKGIFIVIVNYNANPYILECLKSIAETKFPLNQLVVVDNASCDKSVALIKKEFSGIKIINNKNNLGFAKANNLGIKKCLHKGAKYIMLINPDTKVSSFFIEPLIRLLKLKPEAGIVAPLIGFLDQDQLLYDTGAKYNPIIGRTEHINVKARPLHVIEAELVSGCAMLVKKEVFDSIGLFDEKFFLYFEDSDFCLRAGRAGFKIYVEPKSIIYHQLSLSLGNLSFRKNYYNLWSNFVFINKQVKLLFRPTAYFYLLLLGFKMLINKVFKT